MVDESILSRARLQPPSPPSGFALSIVPFDHKIVHVASLRLRARSPQDQQVVRDHAGAHPLRGLDNGSRTEEPNVSPPGRDSATRPSLSDVDVSANPPLEPR